MALEFYVKDGKWFCNGEPYDSWTINQRVIFNSFYKRCKQQISTLKVDFPEPGKAQNQ